MKGPSEEMTWNEEKIPRLGNRCTTLAGAKPYNFLILCRLAALRNHENGYKTGSKRIEAPSASVNMPLLIISFTRRVTAAVF